MARDNGGAIAQKGFNYQNAVISLVAIRNYKRPNFEIFVEADEDFEVTYGDDYHAYIQVKGHKKLSLKSIITSEKSKPSIIEKNLSSGSDESRYKIVVYTFSEKDLKEMVEADDEELFEKGYYFSDSQKSQINNPRSDNLSLILTDFKTESIATSKFLIGEMHNQGISVDKKSDLILSELGRLITQKAEKEIKIDSDKKLKRITAEELEPILQKVSALEKFDTMLDKFNFSEVKKLKIRTEKNKLLLQYSWLKEKVVEKMKCYDLEEISEEEAVNMAINEIPDKDNIGNNTKYAICISAYCDLLEGIENE